MPPGTATMLLYTGLIDECVPPGHSKTSPTHIHVHVYRNCFHSPMVWGWGRHHSPSGGAAYWKVNSSFLTWAAHRGAHPHAHRDPLRSAETGRTDTGAAAKRPKPPHLTVLTPVLTPQSLF